MWIGIPWRLVLSWVCWSGGGGKGIRNVTSFLSNIYLYIYSGLYFFLIFSRRNQKSCRVLVLMRLLNTFCVLAPVSIRRWKKEQKILRHHSLNMFCFFLIFPVDSNPSKGMEKMRRKFKKILMVCFGSPEK